METFSFKPQGHSSLKDHYMLGGKEIVLTRVGVQKDILAEHGG